jgi:hypothetical protein
MQYIKQFFWEDEEEAMQLHPRESEYINNHPFTLHMWRPQFVELPKPPSFMVGLKY